MRAARLVSILTMLLATGHASGACTPLRLGYVNQHRPPYFIGSGSAESSAPGATVELVRDIASSAGCQVLSVRLPPLRLRKALDDGSIDAMLMDAGASDVSKFALPLSANGQLDPDRSVRMYTVVFVRADDKRAADSDPRLYFSSHKLGMNNGASLAAQLRTTGFTVDDGAQDAARNLEKLARGRIDAYAATMVSPANMDSRISATFGKQIVRLEVPLRTHNFWLAFTKTYYQRNRGEVETMWNWVGANGHERFMARVKEYEKAP
jgi:hypothetical protein